jgi:hypothetical protein
MVHHQNLSELGGTKLLIRVHLICQFLRYVVFVRVFLIFPYLELTSRILGSLAGKIYCLLLLINTVDLIYLTKMPGSIL